MNTIEVLHRLLSLLIHQKLAWPYCYFYPKLKFLNCHFFFTGTAMMSASQEQRLCAQPENGPSGTATPEIKDVQPPVWPKQRNWFYRTTNMDYGSQRPVFENAPCTYHPKSNKFSEHLARTRSHSNTTFNTAIDRSRVHDFSTS